LLENPVHSKVDAVVEPLFFAAIGKDTTQGSVFVLAGPEAKHAISVKRMNAGEAIAVSDGAGLKLRGKVARVLKDQLEISVDSVEQIAMASTKLVLVQALAKGDRDELAIQACTELGISEVIPWQADRSISIWKAEKKQKGQARWQSIVTEAAKQSLRAHVPKVVEVLDSTLLIQALQGCDQVLVLDPESKVSITELSPATAGTIAIVVGPEGGISEQELAGFTKAGFSNVHLGSGVLRTSTAGIAALSYLQAKLGDWN
jgi:16S rRNA (uracil1498-N3)-methyltransferase